MFPSFKKSWISPFLACSFLMEGTIPIGAVKTRMALRAIGGSSTPVLYKKGWRKIDPILRGGIQIGQA